MTIKIEDLTTERVLYLIEDEKAIGHSLWNILLKEDERDGFALRPAVWEGPGEYQSVEIFNVDFGLRHDTPNGLVFVKVPAYARRFDIREDVDLLKTTIDTVDLDLDTIAQAAAFVGMHTPDGVPDWAHGHNDFLIDSTRHAELIDQLLELAAVVHDLKGGR